MIHETYDNKFDYGSPVKIKITTPKQFHPGQVGSICGMDKITINSEAQEFFCKVGDWVYTVELPNGSSFEVAECYLELDPDRLNYKLNEQVIIKKGRSREIVSIIDFHKISRKPLAEKFNLDLGDFIYVIEDQNGKISLIPEYFIEKKYE